jgi:hypothetical protein
MYLAEHLRQESTKAQAGAYILPTLHACIYDIQTPSEEVLLSGALNTVTHAHIERSVIDELRHIQRLVEAHSLSSGKAIEPHTLTCAQINTLADLQPIDKAVEREVKTQFSINKCKIFHFVAEHGINVLTDQGVSSAFHTVKTQSKNPEMPDYLSQEYLVQAASFIKDRKWAPTARWLNAAQSVKPWFKSMPTLAHFIIKRLTYCRDATAGPMGTSLDHDSPSWCTSAKGSPRIIEHALAVYFQHMKTLGKAHLGTLKKISHLPSCAC